MSTVERIAERARADAIERLAARLREDLPDRTVRVEDGGVAVSGRGVLRDPRLTWIGSLLR